MEKYQCEVCYKEFKEEDNRKKFVICTEGQVQCKKCCEELWDSKCPRCGCLFYNQFEEKTPACPDCGKEIIPRKVTKKDLEAMFND